MSFRKISKIFMVLMPILFLIFASHCKKKNAAETSVGTVQCLDNQHLQITNKEGKKFISFTTTERIGYCNDDHCIFVNRDREDFVTQKGYREAVSEKEATKISDKDRETNLLKTLGPHAKNAILAFHEIGTKTSINDQFPDCAKKFNKTIYILTKMASVNTRNKSNNALDFWTEDLSSNTAIAFCVQKQLDSKTESNAQSALNKCTEKATQTEQENGYTFEDATSVDIYGNVAKHTYCPGGNLVLYNACGNPTLGRCGDDNNCYGHPCPDCGCNNYCYDHDYYCSCLNYSFADCAYEYFNDSSFYGNECDAGYTRTTIKSVQGPNLTSDQYYVKVYAQGTDDSWTQKSGKNSTIYNVDKGIYTVPFFSWRRSVGCHPANKVSISLYNNKGDKKDEWKNVSFSADSATSDKGNTVKYMIEVKPKP